MPESDFSNEELRAALASADRHMRLPWLSILVATVAMGLATGFALKAADFANPTHVLIVAGFVWIFAWMFFAGSLLQSRQLAANARMLRALELMDERLRDTRTDG